jgi:hypothetical protein
MINPMTEKKNKAQAMKAGTPVLPSFPGWACRQTKASGKDPGVSEE